MQQSKSLEGVAAPQRCGVAGAPGGEAASNAISAGNSIMEIAMFQLIFGQSQDGQHQGDVDEPSSLVE